jgi:phospholipase/carboxylesterase
VSRGRPWDVLVGGYGPDVEFIDQTLKQMFDRLPVDARRLAVTGFSEGASYVLSVGLPDGDLFTHVIAFSPAFASPAAYRGKPPVFVSHGTRDEVLPIDRCSRRSSPSSSVPATRYHATLGETRGNKHRLRFHACKLTDVAEMELQLVAVE